MEAAYLALLQNPDTRTEALLHAQALRQPSGEIGAEAAKWDVLYREILTRPKVAAALAELGEPETAADATPRETATPKRGRA